MAFAANGRARINSILLHVVVASFLLYPADDCTAADLVEDDKRRGRNVAHEEDEEN